MCKTDMLDKKYLIGNLFSLPGNMMTLSYNGGLLSGSLVSYLLLGMLGPPAGAPCRVYPTPPLPTLPPATPPNITFAVTVSH